MKISEKKKSELYEAIADPVLTERLSIRQYGTPQREVIDNRLFKMQNEIWRRVHKILNIDTPV